MKQQGQKAEKLACTYLQTRGLRLIENNYYCKSGEIDLVMQDTSHLVFVEVRYRQYQQFGGALESIDLRKRQHIVAAAHQYLQKHRWARQMASRFDVVTVKGNFISPDIDWLKDAFQAC